MLNYDHTGTAREAVDVTRGWSLMSSEDEASNKEAYLGQSYIDLGSNLRKTWPPSCIALLLAYKRWLFELNAQKMELANEEPEDRKSALKELMHQVWNHYRIVLGFFDTAIGKIESGNDLIPSAAPEVASVITVTDDAPRSPLAPVHEASFSSPFAGSEDDVSEVQENPRTFLKRLPVDDPEDQPEAKRDSSPFTGFGETPSRKTRYYDFPIKRKPQPSPKVNRQSLDEIPEEDEAGESSDELDTL